MKPIPLLTIVAALLLSSPAASRGEVTWRVSVKFINDANDNRPTNGTITSDAAVQDQIDFANNLPTFTQRGVNLELVEILDVFGAEEWFDRDPDADARDELEDEATANTAQFHWRTDAINIYLNNQTAGGCSFPGDGHIIFLGSSNREWVFIHEIGHFMSLEHTHAGERFENQNGSDCDDDDPCANCVTRIAGNDDLSDTLPDNSCWDTRDEVAQGNFSMNWSALSADNQATVDNTRFNIMSYHPDRSLFTTQQLDAMCDTSNAERDSVSHNNFIFVDETALGVAANGQSKAFVGIGGPFAQLANAIDAAGGGDVLLIRPGDYTEDREIRQAITLRAVRRDVLTPAEVTIRAN